MMILKDDEIVKLKILQWAIWGGQIDQVNGTIASENMILMIFWTM